MTDILLARHGETADNLPPMRLMGHRDPPLTPRGRRQAEVLAAAAVRANVAAIVTSPLRRARETAEIVGDAVGVAPTLDARLMESSRGTWEGRLVDDIAREEPELWAAWQRPAASFRFPGGESLGEHRARVREALLDVFQARRPALVVSHGGTVRCALMAMGDLAPEDFHRIQIPHATLIPLAAAQTYPRSNP